VVQFTGVERNLPVTCNVYTGSGNKSPIRWAIHEGKKRPGRETANSPPSRAEAKNEWRSTSAVLMPSWCKEREFVVRWRTAITMGLMGEFTLWWVAECGQQAAVWAMEWKGIVCRITVEKRLVKFLVCWQHDIILLKPIGFSTYHQV